MSDELKFHDWVFGQCTKCVSIIIIPNRNTADE